MNNNIDSSNITIEKVWLEDIKELINRDYILNLFPTKKNNVNQNINAIMRLAICISLVLILFYRKIEYIFIVVCAMIVSYVYYNGYIREFFPDTKDIYKASFSKPHNPVGNKLLFESNNKYDKTYLVSNDNDIKKNILYSYNKIRQKMPSETNISEDLLNTKEALLGFHPLADKTGIPDFAEFAKNTYGTIVEDRKDLIKRGFISKADINRENGLSSNDINTDPLNLYATV
tara:strand:+ start:1531 stop:2223 length:693 start_codon:yes stop_codon:yes gene_type:complete